MCYLQRVGSGFRFSFGWAEPCKNMINPRCFVVEGQRSKQLQMKNMKHQNTQHKLQPIVSVTHHNESTLSQQPFAASLSQQPSLAACLSSLSQWAASSQQPFRSSLSQQPSAAAFLSSLSQQPFSATFLSDYLFQRSLSQQPFSAASSLSPFSAAFLSNLCQRPLWAAFCSSVLQQPFAAALSQASFCSSLSQQGFRSSLCQQPFSAASLNTSFLGTLSQKHHLAVVRGWWSAVWCHFAVATGWSSDCLGLCWKEPLISRKTCTLITHIAVGATLYLATMTTRDARAMKEREREREAKRWIWLNLYFKGVVRVAIIDFSLTKRVKTIFDQKHSKFKNQGQPELRVTWTEAFGASSAKFASTFHKTSRSRCERKLLQHWDQTWSI